LALSGIDENALFPAEREEQGILGPLYRPP
jgi:hypothetical protein